MQVAILGPLEVRDNGRAVAVAGSRLRTLVIRLALDAGRPVSAATLADAVWGEHPPADAANALQTLVSRLRRALGDAGAVVQSAAGYRLAVDRDEVDAHRFERLAGSGSASLAAGDPAAAAEQLTEALGLWRGPALDGAAGTDGAVAVAALRLHDLRLTALVNRAEAELQLGRAAAAVGELEALAAEHPLHERLAAQLVTALAATGRQAEALAQYERVRVRLADELGVDPSAELQAAYLAVLRGEVPGARGPAAGRDQAPARTNLRAQLTSFVGRDAELARIGKSLEEYRLVTVVGPGGAGKTRLASEAVARIVDSVPDGVWLVELASVTDPADVPQTVLGSLGLREAHLLDRPQKLTARDAVTRLVEALTDKGAVLVLDNCEHLIEASARLADTLLARCPQLRIVATSREPLGILGESLLVVPPLGQPAPGVSASEALEYPAVRLFADRAAAVRPGFAVDETVVGPVIEIVRRLDGLPLAIELAAARLRSLPLAEIQARLSDRFRLLTGGSRTALPRHRTLRAVVEWSWDLLGEPERLLAERFAVFPSGATVEAVAQVCAGSGVPAQDVADLVASLVDKSLLQPVSDGARVRMLETIREYGIEQVAERGELPALRRRHADYFSRLMHTAEPHLVRREQLYWLAVVNAEHDNILGALRFLCDVGAADEALDLAVSLSSMAMLLGNNADVATWLADVLAVPGGTDPHLRALGEALYAINFASVGAAGDPDGSAERVQRDLERLHELVAQLDDLAVDRHPFAALLKPAVAMFAGDDRRLARWVDEALASADPWIAAAVRMLRANIAENAGDIGQMRADTAESLRELRRLGERWALANTLRTAGLLHTYDGDLDAAQRDYGEALELMRELGSRDDETFLRVRLADLAVRRGELDAAREQIDLARASADYSGSAMEAVFTLAMAAGIDLELGDRAAARREYGQARVRYESMPAAHPAMSHSGALLHAMGTALAVLDGDLDGARELAGASYRAAVATKDRPIAAACGIGCAELAAALGRPAEAARILGACSTVRGTEDHTNVAVVDLAGRLRSSLGDAAFEAAYAEGRAMDRDAALARLDPALLD